MSERKVTPGELLLEAAEIAFRTGFRAAERRLGWTEDEAWAKAREQFASIATRLDDTPLKAKQ